jgi:hypothetical protein
MRRSLLGGALFSLFLTTAPIALHAATDSAGGVNTMPPSDVATGAADYEFAAPPITNADLVYRVDRITGEVSACQFSTKGPTIGSTVCFPAGEGAGPAARGDYGLVPSNLATASGLFRVKRHTGEMSICYVLNERVVCTAPIR